MQRDGYSIGSRGARYFDQNYPTRTAKGNPACAGAFRHVTGIANDGTAASLIPILDKMPFYRRLVRGESPQMDDVAVWSSDVRPPWGHVGHIVLNSKGEPFVISLIGGVRGKITRLRAGAIIFRKVR